MLTWEIQALSEIIWKHQSHLSRSTMFTAPWMYGVSSYGSTCMKKASGEEACTNRFKDLTKKYDHIVRKNKPCVYLLNTHTTGIFFWKMFSVYWSYRKSCKGKEKEQNIKVCCTRIYWYYQYHIINRLILQQNRILGVRNDCWVAVRVNSWQRHYRLHLKLLWLIFKMTIALENGLQRQWVFRWDTPRLWAGTVRQRAIYCELLLLKASHPETNIHMCTHTLVYRHAHKQTHTCRMHMK